MVFFVAVAIAQTTAVELLRFRYKFNQKTNEKLEGRCSKSFSQQQESRVWCLCFVLSVLAYENTSNKTWELRMVCKKQNIQK